MHLKYLDVSGLTLDRIPYCADVLKDGIFFDHDYHEHGLAMRDTKLLLQPVSLFHQPYELIEDYYRSEKVRISESKVILVGEGGAGKTYLLKRIMNNGHMKDESNNFYQTNETHGINICEYSPNEELNIRFWDFGGQQIMHSMHQCFLTDRTGYVVVINTRQSDRGEKAKEWVRNIRQYAKNAPVMVLLNVWGDDPDDSMVGIKELQSLNPNVTRIARCSIMNAEDGEFERQVVRHIVNLASKLDSHKMEIPVSWNNVRQELIKMRNDNKPYIDYDEYFKICRNNGMEVKEICAWLAEWFNDLGDCFSFYNPSNHDDEFGKYRILQPKWLTKAIYTIITRSRYGRKDGIITRDELVEILKDPITDDLEDYVVNEYNKEECEYILQVMRRFRMSYPISDDEEFIPMLCTGDLPSNRMPKNWKSHFCYEYRYDGYLPDSVLHQLMVATYAGGSRLAKPWKSGFNVRRADTKVDAIIDTSKKRYSLFIDVYSDTERNNAAYLLAWIRDRIHEINSHLSLSPKQYIHTDEGDEFELSNLLNIRMRHRDIYGKDKDYDIDNDLLGLIYTDEAVRRIESFLHDEKIDNIDRALSKQVKRKMLFISHSSKDKTFADLIATFFGDLGFEENVFCSSTAGFGMHMNDNVNDKLQEMFMNDDMYVLFLRSFDFENSKYCQNEVGLALGSGKQYANIVLPGHKAEDMNGMINDSIISIDMNADEYNIKYKLNELYDILTHYFGIKKRGNWEEKRDSLIKEVKTRA